MLQPHAEHHTDKDVSAHSNQDLPQHPDQGHTGVIIPPAALPEVVLAANIVIYIQKYS